MGIYWKVTDYSGMTRNQTYWAVRRTIVIPELERVPGLCASGVLHAFNDLSRALLTLRAYVPYESNYTDGADDLMPRLFRVEGESVCPQVYRSEIKVGAYAFTVLSEEPLPAWYVSPITRGRVRGLVILRLLESFLLRAYQNSGDQEVLEKIREAFSALHFSPAKPPLRCAWLFRAGYDAMRDLHVYHWTHYDRAKICSYLSELIEAHDDITHTRAVTDDVIAKAIAEALAEDFPNGGRDEGAAV